MHESDPRVPLRLAAGLVLATAAAAVQAVQIYAQTPAQPPGDFVKSQRTTAAAGLDSDAVAFDNFTLRRKTRIAHLEWWGRGTPLPAHGFTITFRLQKPGVREPLFEPEAAGEGVAASRRVTKFRREAAGQDAFRFSADFDDPVVLEGGQPYWISIIANMQGFAPWGWAGGSGGDGRSLSWQRGAEETSLRAGGDRAFVLFNDAPPAGAFRRPDAAR